MKNALIIGIIISLLTLYWYFGSDGSLESYVQNADILTLEAKYTAEDIIEKHQKELLGNKDRTFQEPSLQFHPYLLMNVKYVDKNQKTKQGPIIWSQMDGEMVLNTETWEQTRGFEDAIQAGASALEFRVLNVLAAHNGSQTKAQLQNELNLELDSLNALLNSMKQKQLIVIKGNDVSLHFENPLFNVPPQTKMALAPVIKPNREGKKIGARYSRSKIERIAKAAFGDEFTIRDMEEIYLPVLRIPLQNADGTLLITDWNALTGSKIYSGPVKR